MDSIELIKLAAPMMGAAGAAAWAGVKVALNGTRKAIADSRAEASKNHAELKREVGGLTETVTATRLDLAHLKGQLGVPNVGS